MKLTYIKSSTVLIKSENIRVLCDPWLFDGEYYGAWYHYPPLEVDENYYEAVDYIYVSHIHPDHFSRKSFAFLNKSIPVLIHRYETKFLKYNLEKLGFSVIELPNDEPFFLSENFHINIIAADYCNPELCSKFFGCGIVEAKFGSTQIDSLAVFSDGTKSILNVNDCPYELSQSALKEIINRYGKIDLALVGYAGAGPFPQCFDMDIETKIEKSKSKKNQFISQGIQFIKAIKPTYFMPFAGTYILGGRLSELNEYRGVPEIEEALEIMSKEVNSEGMLLNTYKTFDLYDPKNVDRYEAINLNKKKEYIDKVLSKKKLDYENNELPDLADILNLIPFAFNRFLNKRKEIQFSSDTFIIVWLSEKLKVQFQCNSESFTFTSLNEPLPEKYVSYKVDPRLLIEILKGPRFAHWNNSEIGSHIQFKREPDIFERGLFYSMNFFHS